MNEFPRNTRMAFAIMAISASAGASAAQIPMVLSSITGTPPPPIAGSLYTVYSGNLNTTPNPPAWTLSGVGYNDATGLAAAQQALNDGSGNASFVQNTPNTGPGGNVELGKYGSPTTMTGTVNGKSITLSSLDYFDWADNHKALAQRYVRGAAAANGIVLTETQITTIVDTLVPNDPFAAAPWQRLSDPNISYVYIDEHTVNIGLAGFIDAETLLEGMFGVSLPAKPAGSYYQASEVVEVSLGGLDSHYLFGFFATDSGVVGNDKGKSFTGNFNVQIPEPESLALFGLGLAGLLLTRRRR